MYELLYTRGQTAIERTHKAYIQASRPCSAYSGEPHAHPLAPALRSAVTTFGHTRRWFDRMIEARVRGVLLSPAPSYVFSLDF